MPLTAIQVKNAKLTEKMYRLYDEKGLYLQVMPNGSKYWRLKYRRPGTARENHLPLGVYGASKDLVSLVGARDKRDDARKLIKDGIDPAVKKRVDKATSGDTFGAIAEEWLYNRQGDWSPDYMRVVRARLNRDLLPYLRDRKLTQINPSELLAILRRVEDRGAIETARRCRVIAGQVFRYGIATGRAERDITAEIRGALKTAKARPLAAITDPREVGALLRAIDDYQGTHVVRCALRLAPLVFLRPGELRKGEWVVIDLDSALWRIPGNRMKGKREHLVPLADQALAILRDLRPLTGRGRYMFPSGRGPKRPMSDNAILSALRRIDIPKDQMTGHGFRSMASTLLNEQGWNPDAIEAQLAHSTSSAVRSAYNRAAYLDECRRMMQAWADYLDGLRAGGDVVPLNSLSRA